MAIKVKQHMHQGTRYNFLSSHYDSYLHFNYKNE